MTLLVTFGGKYASGFASAFTETHTSVCEKSGLAAMFIFL